MSTKRVAREQVRGAVAPVTRVLAIAGAVISAAMVALLVGTATASAVDINVNPQAPPGSNKILQLVGWVSWGAAGFAVATLLVIGGKFGYERKHGNGLVAENAESVGKVCIGCVIIAIAGGIVGALTAS